MATDGTVGVPDLNTGGIKTVDTGELTNDDTIVVERQRISIGDATEVNEIANVMSTNPSDEDTGLVVRIAANDYEFSQIHELLFLMANTLEEIRDLLQK